MTKRRRSDSITTQIEMIQLSKLEIKPPNHTKLMAGAEEFFNSLILARARDSWNNSDLENAVILANCKLKITQLESEIEEEGDIVLNQRGTQIPNPKHAILETNVRRMAALTRMLQLHAQATQGRSANTAKRTEAEKKLLDQIDKDDDLLAKPDNSHIN